MTKLSLHRRLLAVLAGGFCGTIARYALSLLIQGHMGKSWPYDIFVINITGALLFAFVTALAEESHLIGPTRHLFINVGFLGAYTTFSSLALGDVLLATTGHWLSALIYLLGSLLGGLLAVPLGNMLGSWVVLQLRAALATQSAQRAEEKPTRKLTAPLQSWDR
ncbi:MAG TPA: fluoride efflux transporter CrcB [Ktedonosporobacter sp.]|nr:fluoride efflux transporter CrcB [Ktedonosporobacter sp.]